MNKTIKAKLNLKDKTLQDFLTEVGSLYYRFIKEYEDEIITFEVKETFYHPKNVGYEFEKNIYFREWELILKKRLEVYYE